MTRQFKHLPIDCLQRGRYQPRQLFDDETLKELAESIRSQGLIEPLIVRQLDGEQYEIIAGERRWRASMLIGLELLPCIIGQYSDEQAAAVSLIENIQRENLNLIEEANAYHCLLEEFNYPQQELADMVGKSRSHIANVLRLLSLSEAVQNALKARQLSLGHARMLVGLSAQEQLLFLQQIKSESWSVRHLEHAVKKFKDRVLIPAKNRDIERLEAVLGEQMGAPVQIVNEEGTSGWLKVKFFDNDTLAGLLERMGLRYD